jgi:hypothetical protein
VKYEQISRKRFVCEVHQPENWLKLRMNAKEDEICLLLFSETEKF